MLAEIIDVSHEHSAKKAHQRWNLDLTLKIILLVGLTLLLIPIYAKFDLNWRFKNTQSKLANNNIANLFKRAII